MYDFSFVFSSFIFVLIKTVAFLNPSIRRLIYVIINFGICHIGFRKGFFFINHEKNLREL